VVHAQSTRLFNDERRLTKDATTHGRVPSHRPQVKAYFIIHLLGKVAEGRVEVWISVCRDVSWALIFQVLANAAQQI
jgi:hypothetical protein